MENKPVQEAGWQKRFEDEFNVLEDYVCGETELFIS